MMITIIIFTISLILLVWFRTDAYLEYCKLFRLNYISKYKEFNLTYSNDVSITYHGYLRQYHNSFFIRLITCPTCLTIWLAFPFSLYTSIILYPIYVISSLFIYLIIDKLLK